GAGGVPRLAHAVEIFAPAPRRLRVGAPEGVLLDLLPAPGGAVDGMRSHLHQRAADDHLRPEDLACDGAGGDAARRLARRGAAAAAIVADAVFLPVGVVGVARPEAVLDRAVVLRALVDIVDDERDRRAGGQPLEDARE